MKSALYPTVPKAIAQCNNLNGKTTHGSSPLNHSTPLKTKKKGSKKERIATLRRKTKKKEKKKKSQTAKRNLGV